MYPIHYLFALTVVLFLSGVSGAGVSDVNKHLFCVSDFGAVGDGKANETSVIQSAIDACSQSGGGKVYFGPGTYLVGTIVLRSHVSLYLEAGAFIVGSSEMGDYPRDPYSRKSISGALFIGEGIENVAFEGRGCIEGSGPAFWETEMCNEYALKAKSRRPKAVFLLANSTNIVFRDITIQNSPCYTVWIMGCDKVRISGVIIDNPRNGPNTDALDIDCSSNVCISDCIISAGDDCIALKSAIQELGRSKACENIVVSNCTLSSSTCAIRLGYQGDGVIRNCVFSNLAIYDTNKGIDIISILPVPHIDIRRGARISNLIFSDIVMDDVKQAIYIWQGDESGGKLQGQIEQVSINNLRANSSFASFIGSLADKAIKDIRLNNVKITINGCLEDTTFDVPCVWSCPEIPWGLYMKNIEDLSLHHVQVGFAGARGVWQGLVKVEDCREVELNFLKAAAEVFSLEMVPIILADCVDVMAFNAGCNFKAKCLFLVQGSKTRAIQLVSHNLKQVERLFEVAEGVNADEIHGEYSVQ